MEETIEPGHPEASSTLKQKTAKGLMWGGISNGLNQLLGAGFGIYLARMLSVDDYGLVMMLTIFSSLSTVLIESGFNTALTNRKKFCHRDFNSVFWFNIGIGTVLYTVLFFMAPLIARFYGRPELVLLSRVVFLGFLFGSFSVAQNAYLFKNLMVKERAKIDLLSLLISLSVAVVLAYYGFGYWALAVQSTLLVLLTTLLRWWFTPWGPTWEFSFQPIREMYKFSSRILFTISMWHISTNIFSVLLGRLYNATQVGYYAQGWKWMNMGQQMLTGMISLVAQPVFVEAGEDKERLVSVIRKMNRFGACLSFPLMLGLAFVAREFIVLTIGEKWLPSVPFLQLFCFWGAIGYLWHIYAYLLLAFERSDLYLKTHLALAAFQLLSILLLYPLGIFPMIVGYVMSFYLSVGYAHYHVAKRIPLRAMMVLRDCLPYLGITAVSFGVAWTVSLFIQTDWLLLLVKIIVAAGVYVLILWRTNSVIFQEMMKFALSKLQRN